MILHHEKQFDCMYHMTYETFIKLVQILLPSLEQNDKESISSCGQPTVTPVHILGLTIYWLSGSSFYDIQSAGKFSHPAFFFYFVSVYLLSLNARNFKCSCQNH
jgi:hypothetical protein